MARPSSNSPNYMKKVIALAVFAVCSLSVLFGDAASVDQAPPQPVYLPRDLPGEYLKPKVPPARTPDLLAPTGQVGQAWVPLGPAPTRNGGATVPPNNEVSGAIQSFAPHPTNADILFVGSVNGGVWRTANATAASPTWTALTDTLPSLSIGAIEFDPGDSTRQTLVAGSGRLSSFGAVGGTRIGVLRTTDGGNTWTALGTSTFSNENLLSVAARGPVILAASDSQWGFGAGSGVFRSTNAGTSFALVSGGSGLSAGPVSDLVGDPASQNRFFAAVRTVGIFRSDTTGATWTNVTGNITGITASTTKIEMAMFNNGATTAVYVAVLNSKALESVWRSTNLGASWTQMDTPVPGGQGDVHFSIATDAANPSLVYIGGQSGLFRGDALLPRGSQFTSLQGGNASNTTPHPDAREMFCDANGNLLESNDGGIYRRLSPQSNGSPWVSVIGNLAVCEAHDVAYDSVAHVAMIGTQDNGTHIQISTGSTVWTSISGSDGGDVAIDDTSSPGQSLRYGSSQDLGGFYRRTYNAANAQVSTAFPALTVLNGGPPIGVQYVTPVELNKVDPTHLIIGGSNAVYESLNRGDTVTALTPISGTFTRQPIAYGGWLAGTPNPDVLYYGSDSTVKLRTTAGGAVADTATAFPGGYVQDLVLDRNNWQHVFVAGSASVYFSANSGASWTNITGNLTGVGSLHTLEFFRFNGTDCVAVGTDLGVYCSFVDSLGTWVKLGSGFPNAVVYDMTYNPADSALVASTMGRGVFLQSIPSAPLASDLSSLVLSTGTLTPAFAARITNYSASVSYATTSVTVTPTTADPGSTVKVNGISVVSGSASGAINLIVGSNAITTVVTNGLTTKTYVITVTRAAAQPGDFDPTLRGYANNQVHTAIEQWDGNILLGGSFTEVNGMSHNRFARMKPDGRLDLQFYSEVFQPPEVYIIGDPVISCFAALPDFDTFIAGNFSHLRDIIRNYTSVHFHIARLGGDGSVAQYSTPDVQQYGSVFCTAVQPDGKIVIGGSFTSVGGQVRNRLARLSATAPHTLDTAFNPSFDGTVRCVAIQSNGQLLVGGDFTSVGSVSRRLLARLNDTGILDQSFNPSVGSVDCIAVLPNDKILIGGGQVARLNSNGTIDATFSSIGGSVSSLALQTDGEIIVGGGYLANDPGKAILRLNSNGSVDPTFSPSLDSYVNGVTLLQDGKVFIVGDFYVVNGNISNKLARLMNGTATQNLSVSGPSRIEWLRGGTSPEAQHVTFEISTNGATWSLLGSGTRIAGGWERTGMSLPASGYIRARARTICGYRNGSSGLMETISGFGPDADNDGLLDTWELTYWPTTAGHTALDDFDRDGVPELLEEAFSLNPTMPDAASLPRAVNEGGYLTITITKHAGVTYEVQSAGTLLSGLGNSFSPATTTVLLNNSATLKVRDNVLIGTPPARFLRVKVTAVP